LVNLGFLFVSIRALGNLITDLFENLSQDLAAAIEEVVKQASSIEMPDVNPLQLMVMEMIKNKIEQNNTQNELKSEPKEILRNADGKFTKDTSL